MPFNDRKCTNEYCKHEVVDHIETTNESADELIECPKCHCMFFKKVWRTGGFFMTGEGTSYSFFKNLDNDREASANGHGNTSIRL